MADTDLVVVDESEFDPNVGDEYLESMRPYLEALKPEEVESLLAFESNQRLIYSNKNKERAGKAGQLEAMYDTWKRGLWEFALYPNGGRRYKTQDEWLDDLEEHGIEFAEHSPQGAVKGRATFYQRMKHIDATLSIKGEEGEKFSLDFALKGAIQHPGYWDTLEKEKLVEIEIKRGIHKKKHGYSVKVTELGEEKLLKGGLKTLKEYTEDIFYMPNGRKSMATIHQDVGRTSYYCSNIVQSGVEPFIDRSKAHNFACVGTISDSNGYTNYPFEVSFPEDTPKEVRDAMLRRLWDRYVPSS